MTIHDCSAAFDAAPFSLMPHFLSLHDPRREHGKLHPLEDILVLTICAVICGADSFVAIEAFGHAKHDFLRRFLALPNGIPSHDTIRTVFTRLDPRHFEQCFLNWVNAVFERTAGKLVAIDGKTLRRSYDRTSKKAALQMVSAWASTNRLVLGQVQVDATSNEITAIPKLLEVLDVSGCIVTIDAMGCQQDIAAQIIDQGGDYVLAVKANQGSLFTEVHQCFADIEAEGMCFYETEEQRHGREETRWYWMTETLPWPLRRIQWKGLRSMGVVEASRTVGAKYTVERRYYISSLPADAQQLAEAVRGHWHIENQLHWVLDVAFREDESRIRTGHADANMAVVRRIALNLLKQDTSVKLGIANKRLKAGWDEAYLLRILLQE
ncbi:MAG: ISAs1 family transposase [Chloroflexota bacterium]|nr:ISAs1 family transposase [Chloroflexota bacterium]